MREATWDKVDDLGVTAEWQCSACKKTWMVVGIRTPYGLGHTECPNCNAKIVGVNQNMLKE